MNNIIPYYSDLGHVDEYLQKNIPRYSYFWLSYRSVK